MVEHGSNKPRVLGSSPSMTTFWTIATERKKERLEVLPRFELGSPDSKSDVITNYTIGPQTLFNAVRIFCPLEWYIESSNLLARLSRVRIFCPLEWYIGRIRPG